MLEARRQDAPSKRAILLQETSADCPYRRIDGHPGCGLLLLCDHASNVIPEAYGSLGLPAHELHRHIAYDIGVAGVTERLAEALGAPALLTRFSRLLIDPNRGADDPTLIMQLSDCRVVPGNAALDEAERAARIARYYEPYHRAIETFIDAALATGKPPVVLAIHSFTSVLKGVKRPWHVTVLWDKDPRLALPLLEGLQALPGIVADDNVPYSGELKGDTLYRHATMRGLAHALIELRQDLILSREAQSEWADRLARVLRKLLQDSELAPQLHRVEHYGSHTDSAG
jgi:predicted N-formylglutamate amidohydrolase